MECLEQQREKPVVKVRAVIKNGSSYYISIPREFMKRHGIEKGDKLAVLAGQIMKVIPMNEE
jgi:hypothetical protein